MNCHVEGPFVRVNNTNRDKRVLLSGLVPPTGIKESSFCPGWCYQLGQKCHQEGHKYNKCLQPKKKLSDEKNKKKLTIKSSLICTKPNRRNKSNNTSYVIKKKTNGKVVAHKVGKKERSWNHSIWVL